MSKDVRMKGFARRVSVAHAWSWVDGLQLARRKETVDLEHAFGRVLGEDIKSPVSVPGFRRSMMDGYAVMSADILGATTYNPIDLEVIGEVLPGQLCQTDIQSRQAIQVMTGAQVPDSADAVVPVEFSEKQPHNSIVSIQTSIAAQKNVARIGEDISSDQIVLRQGRILRAQDIAILASIGHGQVTVAKAPQINIIVTGNELLPVGKKPSGVQIVDSNSVMLKSLVRRDGGEPQFPGILPDDPATIQSALETPADVILISGGSSTGKEDHAPVLVREMGELVIHGIAMRPSSPAGMGIIQDRPVFLLPGNPVSCLCAYDFFAGRVIRSLAGLNADWPYPRKQLPLRTKISSQIGRTDYARVKIIDQGVEPIAISGASILSSTIEADGFCIIPEESEGYARDTEVEVFLY